MSSFNCVPPSVIPPGDETSCSTLQGQALFTYWCNNNCIETYSNILNTNGDIAEYNPAELSRVQADIVSLFQSYLSTNIITDDVTDPAYTPFQNTLLNLCLSPNLPGVCNTFLANDFCQGLSRTQISDSPVLTDFCGCYAPINQNYITYTNDPACDTLCHREDTVQLANPSTGVFQTCSNSICVIDDVSIIVNQSSTGGINFEQICGGCSQTSSPCECIISGVSITAIADQVGIEESFSQVCGANSICLQINPDESVTPVPCSSINPNPPGPTNSTTIPIAVVIIVIIVIVVLIISLVATKG